MKVLRRSMRFSPARVVGLTLGGLILSTAAARADSTPGRTIALETIVTIPAHDTTIRCWIPVPLESSVQQVHALNTSSPAEHAFHHDALHGNRYLYTELPPATEEQTVSWRATVLRQEWTGPQAEKTTAEQLAEYRKPLRLVPVGGALLEPRLASLNVKHADTNMKGRALFDYVLREMRYDKSVPGWGTGSVQFACDARTGNCSDFHALFNGLARTADMPARFTMGMTIPLAPVGDISGYHCWTAYWIEDQGWMPADISEADKHPENSFENYHGYLNANRIALTRGRDLTLSPPQDGPPLNFAFGPYLESGGEPLAGFATVTRIYRDVSPQEPHTVTGE